MHRVLWDGNLPAAGALAVIRGDEAEHAVRTKRLRVGEAIEILDRVGGTAICTVERAGVVGGEGRKKSLEFALRVTELRQTPPPRPSIEVWAATPKGARVDDLVEGLSEVGATSWTPLITARTVVEPRATKLDRLRKVADESAKQCGRPWVLTIARERPFAEALIAPAGTRVVFADEAGGVVYRAEGPSPLIVRILIGPEGGWADQERESAHAAGAIVAGFGPHVMRVDTAAVVAAAIIIDRHREAANG